ncbi:MAG: hypothetical protein AB1757_06060 [Acidobacteriota bacterium]
MNKKRIWLIAGLSLLVVAGFTTRAWLASATQPAMPPATSSGIEYVPQALPRQDRNILGLLQRGALPSRLHTALDALGDRLERRGRERALIAGRLQYGDGTPEINFTAILQLPRLLRLTESVGSVTRTIVFDGKTVASSEGKLAARDSDLLETLLYDTAEHLLLEQVGGTLAMRFLGERFHTSEALDSPAYDIFEVTDTVMRDTIQQPRTKNFYFNSASHLLERIAYGAEEQGAPLIEVRLSDWRTVDGQRAPFRFERLENNVVTLRLQFTSMAYVGAVEDGAFSVNR